MLTASAGASACTILYGLGDNVEPSDAGLDASIDAAADAPSDAAPDARDADADVVDARDANDADAFVVPDCGAYDNACVRYQSGANYCGGDAATVANSGHPGCIYYCINNVACSKYCTSGCVVVPNGVDHCQGEMRPAQCW